MSTTILSPAVCFCLVGALAAPSFGRQWSQQLPTPTPVLRSVQMRSALDVLTAGTVASDGLLRHSTNGSTTWTDVALDGEVAAVHFLSGGVGMVAGDGIRRTDDNGLTWTVVDGTSALRDLHFATAAVGFACGAGGSVRKTDDGGLSWSDAGPSGHSGVLNKILFFDALVGWTAGAGGAVFHTTDGGASWTQQVTGTTADFTGLTFTSPSEGWVCGDGQVLRTANAGVTWLATAFPAGASCRAVRALTGIRAFVCGDGGTIRESTNGGQTWTTRLNDPTGDLLDLDFGDFFDGFAVGTNGATYRTTNGGASWSLVSGGGSDPVPYLYGFDSTDASHAWAATYLGVWRTDDGGASWASVPVGALTIYRDVAFADDGIHGYACGTKQATFPTVAWTSNGGLTWESFALIAFFDLLTVAVADPLTAVAAGETWVRRTTDGGQTWSNQSPSPFGTYHGSTFANSTTGWIVGTRIKRTDDGGLTWTPQTAPGGTLRDVAFVDPSTGWAVGDGGTIIHTTNGGANWVAQSAPGATQLNGVSAVDASTVWIAGAGGYIAFTTDGGATWTTESAAGLGNPTIMTIDVDDQGFGWIAGVDGMGVWHREASGCSATAYCSTAPNSAGSGATMSVFGSTSVSANDLVLRVQACPPTQNGLFFYGPGQTQAPFGNGHLCIDGGFFRLPIVATNASGVATFGLDVTLPPSAGGDITAFSTWNFQFWYRDPAAGGASFNLSDGISVEFCP